MENSVKVVIGVAASIAFVAVVAVASHTMIGGGSAGSADAPAPPAAVADQPTPEQDDAKPHQWWTAEMFRQMGGCFNNGGSPAKEIKEEQARFEEPRVVVHRNAGGYTVSVEVHEPGEGYSTYYRSKADCDAANPVHAVDADNYN
jgi:hypothetical protein